MHYGHLTLIRVLVIGLSLALVGLTFVHHHQKGQITTFLIAEMGLAIILAIASIAIGVLW